MPPKVIVIAAGKVYGPFESYSTAQTWIRGNRLGAAHWDIYSLWMVTKGTIDHADECGTLLESSKPDLRVQRVAPGV